MCLSYIITYERIKNIVGKFFVSSFPEKKKKNYIHSAGTDEMGFYSVEIS